MLNLKNYFQKLNEKPHLRSIFVFFESGGAFAKAKK
jgi:hypothetical protein